MMLWFISLIYYVAIKSKGYSDIENVCGTVNEKQGLQLKSIVILDIFSVMFDFLLCVNLNTV